MPSESWDDDFVFQRAKDHPNIRKSDSDEHEPSWSMSTSQDRRGESLLLTRHSSSSLSQIDGKLPIMRLQKWAEPGPSTPPKHTVPQTENWDDDFEDKTDSPVRHPPSRLHRQPSKLPGIPEPENWDDDLDGNKFKFASPKKHPAWDSSDEEDGTDFADQEEEDKTVTARPRKVALKKSSPPPPIPLLPLPLAPVGEAFPGSPAMSVFSIPSGRDSATYSSLAHLPLRGGSASAIAMLPPSPPAQKERRRLRKKSRPPDNNVFELLDRQQDIIPLPSPPQPSSPNPPAVELPPSETFNSSRTSILSRIGSVKKWGVRRRRTSPGPGDNPASAQPSRDSTPRPATSPANPSSRTPSWFFRSSEPDSTPGSPSLGSSPLELKHERSFRHLKATFAAIDSPTKQGRILAAVLGERSHDSGSASTPEGSPPVSLRRPRRPKSMQVPSATQPQFPRHASYGARSVSRSTSHTSTDDVSHESEGKGKEKEREREREGHRSFMSSVRRISLVSGKKHKRTRSSATVPDSDELRDPLPSVPRIPPSAIMLNASISAQLLPPIELQPPSPPREQLPDYESRKSMASERSIISISESLSTGVVGPLLLQPSVVDAKSLASPPSVTPRPSPTKSPGSPQSASLGRATQPPSASAATGIVPRRNSLGDLKIPARISQAQVGLKRDLGMVREFAAEVEKLKDIQSVYQSLEVEAQAVLLERARHPPPRATSPTFFHLPRPRSRARSNTSPNPFLEIADPHKRFSALFFHLDHKYKISWECAQLLIELGGGPPATPATPPPNSSSSFAASAPQSTRPGDSISSRKSRERAITLAGDESAPPIPTSFANPPTTSPPGEWRASMGRNDLSQRQLWLLRDMLNKSSDSSSPTMLAGLQIPEEEGPVNRNWRWGEATSSTITLPSEESARNSGSSPTKKRRYSRLGMSGLRDMLRSLTRGHTTQPPIPFRPASSASTSASSTYDDQSINEHGNGHSQQQHRPSKSSTGPEDVTPSNRATSPFSTAPALSHKKSPRRPSIASIFRFAQKGKPSPPSNTGADLSFSSSSSRPPAAHILHSYSSGSDLGSRNGTVDCDGDGGGGGGGGGCDDDDEEDWDHIESAEDLDAAAARVFGLKDLNGTATVRGRRSKSQRHQQQQQQQQQRNPYHLEREHRPSSSGRKGIDGGSVVTTTTANGSQSSISLWNDSPSTASRSQVSLAATAVPPTAATLPSTPASSFASLPPQAVTVTTATTTTTTTTTSYLRPTRLSNVEEIAEGQIDNDHRRHHHSSTHIGKGSQRAVAIAAEGKNKSPRRTSSRLRRGGSGVLSGSVRSAPPPTPLLQDGDRGGGIALSLTPETIRPLLENAREVHARCTECIDELRALLAARPSS
ncbi:hypothetical protein B0F90DRAFT_1820436 [Multifurca ochricompacta]|uniref:Uncharacterized protein n=1 Tax=Multifurca ochricompacta TaxID=376703 RepID=A0AAD4LZC2_9AGAM|nr:hypothetical protein B0F90DRAFT_1820436 [Multifurca ochricompacta]